MPACLAGNFFPHSFHKKKFVPRKMDDTSSPPPGNEPALAQISKEIVQTSTSLCLSPPRLSLSPQR